MNDLAKDINQLLLETPEIKEYKTLKKEIAANDDLRKKRDILDALRKEICKDKSKDSSEYYELLEAYRNDLRIRKYEKLNKEIKEVLLEISDILTLK